MSEYEKLNEDDVNLSLSDYDGTIKDSAEIILPIKRY